MEERECSAKQDFPLNVGKPAPEGAPPRATFAQYLQPNRPAPMPLPELVGLEKFEPSEKEWMLQMARNSIAGFVSGAPPLVFDPPPGRLARKQACFVTLYRMGALRGCVGSVQPLLPLYRAVVDNAEAAASRDPRFSPLTAAELDGLRIQISVLTEPLRLSFDSPEGMLSQLQPGISGVLLQIGDRVGTFLPQVWRQIPDRAEFLNRLSEKAGLPADAWRWPGAAVWVYRAECFGEPDPLGHN